MRVVKPRNYSGVEIHPVLIRSAKKKGLTVERNNAETSRLKGELGILWGVVHHFENPVRSLRRLNKNFDRLIIRENVNKYRPFEMGRRYDIGDMNTILKNSGGSRPSA